MRMRVKMGLRGGGGGGSRARAYQLSFSEKGGLLIKRGGGGITDDIRVCPYIDTPAYDTVENTMKRTNQLTS